MKLRPRVVPDARDRSARPDSDFVTSDSPISPDDVIEDATEPAVWNGRLV